MPDKHHLDNDFEKIDCLYLDYIRAMNGPNNENLLLQIKEKIVVAFWKTLQKASSITPEMIEHTDLLVEKIYYCMDKCSENDDFHGFCKYTYVSIVKALRAEADKDAFEEETGMHLTDNKMRKKIENAYKQYKAFNSDDKQKFMEYAIVYLGFKKKDLELYLFPRKSISLYAASKVDSNEEYCVADKCIDTTKKETPEECLSSNEELKNRLDSINKVWLKQKEETRIVLSELITRDLLADTKKNNKSEGLLELFAKYEFICKPMVQTFFSDINYELPIQESIGKKYGITKSAASVKLKRFYKMIKR